VTDERDHERLRDNISAYVIGSLEPGEVAELDQHLHECESCAREARWLAPAADVLLEAVEPLEPPRDVRKRVLAEVREDARKRSREGAGRWSLRGFLMRPATALAAVFLIAAGVYFAAGDGDGITQSDIPERPDPDSLISATLEREGDTGTLELTGLRQLEEDRVYQAWVQHGDRMEDSSLFAPRADGTATAAIPHDDLRGGDAVLVTVEPRGGSRRPTADPLVSVDLD
jgi:anti-sigma-K factor RskA